MRIVRLTLWAGCLAAQAWAAPIVGFQVSSLGPNFYRYTYFPSGIAFTANQELDILFDPATYGTLSNGKAPSGFDVLLVQPNNPPGAFGEYSALALVNNPPLTGTFSVDFTFLGLGLPGSQPFTINQLDANGRIVSTTPQQLTTPQGSTNVPEPATVSLAAAGMLIGGLLWATRRLVGH